MNTLKKKILEPPLIVEFSPNWDMRSTSVHSKWMHTRIFILVNCELINLIVPFILLYDITIILVVNIIMLYACENK